MSTTEYQTETSIEEKKKKKENNTKNLTMIYFPYIKKKIKRVRKI